MNPTFAVGDTVSYNSTDRGQPYVCTIVRVMPEEHAQRSYRVRSDEEVFQRSVMESTLTRIVPSAAERAFEQ